MWHPAEQHRFGNYLAGTHVAETELCGQLAMVAPA
jgi:hypothetical protein